MENEPYVNSTVLIYDAKLYVRKQSRSILNILGFWKRAYPVDADTRYI